jgi:hypothetical protein
MIPNLERARQRAQLNAAKGFLPEAAIERGRRTQLNGGCLSGNGPMHLVLNGLEELNADIQGWIIVDTGGVNVGDLLIKPSFRRSDILYAPFELFKIIEWVVRIFQPLIIQQEAFFDKLGELLCCPDAKTGGHVAFYSVPHGDNHVQIVKIDSTGYFSFPLCLNYPEIPDSCFGSQLSFIINILYMLIYSSNILLKKLRH